MVQPQWLVTPQKHLNSQLTSYMELPTQHQSRHDNSTYSVRAEATTLVLQYFYLIHFLEVN